MCGTRSGDLPERVRLGAERARMGGHANALTAQEQQEGWILLFDGRSLDKWNVTPALAKVFKVGEGAIKLDLSDAGGTMLTKDTFDNFVLKVEFRAHPDINSGIILRSPAPRPAPPAGEKPTPDPADPATSCRFATETRAITAAAISSRAAS